jgi:FK506-binding nuclear protein
LKAGEKEVVIPQSDLRITNAALGDELKDKSGRTIVKLTYPTAVPLDSDDDDGDSPEALSSTFLCSLTAGKVRSSTAVFIT